MKKKKIIDTRKSILKKINEIEHARDETILYLHHWVFLHNIRIDDPTRQDAFTNQVRARLQEVREYNYQIKTLRSIIEGNSE